MALTLYLGICYHSEHFLLLPQWEEKQEQAEETKARLRFQPREAEGKVAVAVEVGTSRMGHEDGLPPPYARFHLQTRSLERWCNLLPHFDPR